ncbi:hypothetical protein UFOVP435_62 [uncultured Caudovirales phage]|uniref:Uncharacterized protein n=1 Tax=uncultured Caudovirales phage TaxID=2100421 RepID=A0A6J5MHD5_9CAUD|nr:hypothetical protein UFOVP435_62 [uncultured Caudovirales phage]
MAKRQFTQHRRAILEALLANDCTADQLVSAVMASGLYPSATRLKTLALAWALVHEGVVDVQDLHRGGHGGSRAIYNLTDAGFQLLEDEEVQFDREEPVPYTHKKVVHVCVK